MNVRPTWMDGSSRVVHGTCSHNDRASQLFATTTIAILVTRFFRAVVFYALARFHHLDHDVFASIREGRFVESDEYNGRIVEEREEERERERERGDVVDPNHTEYAERERVWFEDGQGHAPGSRINDKKGRSLSWEDRGGDDDDDGVVVVVVVVVGCRTGSERREHRELGTGHDEIGRAHV